MKLIFITLFHLLSSSFTGGSLPPDIPLHYVCYHTPTAPHIDGVLDDECWKKAPWTASFQDIRGKDFPKPAYDTRVKMLWDDHYFYVAAYLEEPHIQGTITQRDAVIFHDNDFEVFIDPDGDTHLYYEFEMNALNTIWDLLLVKPYREGGPALNGYDAKGLRSAVYIDGTLNDPSDIDKAWYVEIAFPLDVLAELNGNRKPSDGDQWRVNFSRVEWHTTIENGKYVKEKDPISGKTLPEENWVWSPQGVVDMHRPEMWGFIHFSK